jgi:hypothetical protein
MRSVDFSDIQSPAFAGFQLGLLFYFEDGSDKFLRNVELCPNYTVLQPRRPYCPWSPL